MGIGIPKQPGIGGALGTVGTVVGSIFGAPQVGGAIGGAAGGIIDSQHKDVGAIGNTSSQRISTPAPASSGMEGLSSIFNMFSGSDKSQGAGDSSGIGAFTAAPTTAMGRKMQMMNTNDYSPSYLKGKTYG